ncbi:MAG TPA: hypothetical protein VGM91_07430 [Conexibacter sp.]
MRGGETAAAEIEQSRDLGLVDVRRCPEPHRVEPRERHLSTVPSQLASVKCGCQKLVGGKHRRIGIVDQAVVLKAPLRSNPSRRESGDQITETGAGLRRDSGPLEFLDQLPQAVCGRFGTNGVQSVGERPKRAFVKEHGPALRPEAEPLTVPRWLRV